MAIAATVSIVTPAVFAGKVDTDGWFPVVLVDTTDDQTGEVSVAFGDLDVEYRLADGSGGWSTYTPATGDWNEAGDGVYELRIGASEFTAAGNYIVKIGDTAPNGHAVVFCVEVTAATLDDLVRSTTPANTLAIDASGYVRLEATTHSGAVIPTVSALTGHTAQTGDNYARLGAPSGASVSADVLAIVTDTIDIQSRIPAALVGGNIPCDVKSWVGTTVTLSATSAKPQVDVDSVKDVAQGATDLKDNIAYLDASILTRTKPADAQTIDLTQSVAGSTTDDTVGKALNSAELYLDAATSSRAAIADWTSALATKLDTNVDVVLSTRSAPGTAQTLDLTQAISEGQSALTVGGSLELTNARQRHKYSNTGAGGAEIIYRSNGTTPLVTRSINAAGTIYTPA